MTEPQTIQLPAAQPTYATRPGVGPGLVVMLTALGLILLGGCFLIGVLAGIDSTMHGDSGDVTPVPLMILQVVLYVLAFACFGGAIFLIGLGIKWLRDVMWSTV